MSEPRTWLDIKRTREADPGWLRRNRRSLSRNPQVRIGRAKMHQALANLEKARQRVQAHQKYDGLLAAIRNIGSSALRRMNRIFSRNQKGS